MTDTMKQIVLASRPTGVPVDANFRLETGAMPTAGEGEVLVRVQYLSLDPYMRGRMNDVKSYADHQMTPASNLAMSLWELSAGRTTAACPPIN
jgi:NADPH-dependent curcumin reductase CurA